ncbi:MAG: glycoside hydrolase family 15 protein [Dehalococcoidia bacterium]|nr:glycoside hydrolase family 15 protein [Dehalococcoidia bacterium]
MAYKRINDYGVIGDMHSAALVGSDASIDWLCFPRFDSPSVFAAILDDGAGGRFQVSPPGDFTSRQRYLPDSNVLVTEFETPSGGATLTDFMPVGEQITQRESSLIRLLRCERGAVEMDLHFQPRLDYARGRTEVSVQSRVAVARHGRSCLSLSSAVDLEAAEGAARARFTVRQGESAAFVVAWGQDSPPPVDGYDVHGRLGQTEAFWRFVSQDWRYTGRWEQVVKRSMLALHLLLYVPSGTVCAAVTTSLPERIGGVRNWDYRFSWLRDAAFTMDVFHRLGHTTYTKPFVDWLANLAICESNGDLHSLYSIEGRNGHELEEYTLDHLEGYRASRPVRVGNAAFHQFQLDVFGEIMLALDSYQRVGGAIDERLWNVARCLVEAAVRRWREPDLGIWEFRTGPRHFTYSKLMAWVAVDRGLRLARALRRPVDFDGWRKAREEIRQDILTHGWNAKRGSFIQHYGGVGLDASLLFIPMVGFLAADDPRMNATIDAVWKELGVDGLVYRYLPELADDGLPGREGTFTMCSLWLAGSLVAAGRLQEARDLFERVLSLGNHVGLYSEMLDPETGDYLGNYPQAFTHIALIHTARNLDRALKSVELGKVITA